MAYNSRRLPPPPPDTETAYYPVSQYANYGPPRVPQPASPKRSSGMRQYQSVLQRPSPDRSQQELRRTSMGRRDTATGVARGELGGGLGPYAVGPPSFVHAITYAPYSTTRTSTVEIRGSQILDLAVARMITNSTVRDSRCTLTTLPRSRSKSSSKLLLKRPPLFLRTYGIRRILSPMISFITLILFAMPV
jgi:hypothetical protein